MHARLMYFNKLIDWLIFDVAVTGSTLLPSSGFRIADLRVQRQYLRLPLNRKWLSLDRKLFCETESGFLRPRYSDRILKIFSQDRHNSAMIIDRRKFITKWCLCRMSSFHFTVNQFKVIPLAWTLRTRNLPQIFCDVGRGLTARQTTLTSFSRRQPVTIDYWVTLQ